MLRCDPTLTGLRGWQYRSIAPGAGAVRRVDVKPLAAALGLTDSPAGSAAWIVEKVRAWSDHCPGETSVLDRAAMLADVTIFWLCFEALWRKDQGLDHTTQANMVKWWAPKLAVEAVHQALLTFGHAAWSKDNPQAQRLRDVMGFEIADGTAQIAKLVVARTMFGREFAPP